MMLAEKKESIVEKLERFELELKGAFPERETVIEQSLDSLIASEHVLFLGPPGTAKSMIARAFSDALDVRLWSYMFTRFTTPDEILGPVKLSELENDRYIRNPKKKLPEADVAVFEEVFKGNSACINATLGICNERIWHNDGEELDVPMRTAFMNSNELPTDKDGLGAFLDRIVSRVYVGDIVSREAFEQIMYSKPAPIETKFSLDELDELMQIADSLTVTDDARDALWNVRLAMLDLGIYCSPRRYSKSLKIAAANAARHGDTEILPCHLNVLRNILWDKPEQFESVARIVDEHTAPWKKEFKLINDAVTEIFSLLKKRRLQSTDVSSKIRYVRELCDGVKDPRAESAVKKTLSLCKAASAEVIARTKKELR